MPLTQQPRPRQTLPSQHGWSGPPQTAHALDDPEVVQTVLEVVQNGLELVPQQACPGAPQLPQEPGSVWEQVPASPPPQAVPAARHFPATQQESPPQVRPSQHGAPGEPQSVKVPSTHTFPGVAPALPLGTHRFHAASKHAPPEQALAPGHRRDCAVPQLSIRFGAVQTWSE